MNLRSRSGPSPRARQPETAERSGGDPAVGGVPAIQGVPRPRRRESRSRRRRCPQGDPGPVASDARRGEVIVPRGEPSSDGLDPLHAVFGTLGAEFAGVSRDIVQDAEGRRVLDIIEDEEFRKIMMASPEKGQAIYWREMLQRTYFASLASLRRQMRW